MKLGFVGLGTMGRPIAHNLSSGPEPLAVSSAADRHFAEFEAKGIPASLDPRSVADANLVMLCLPDGKVVQEVLFGEGGLAGVMRRGAIVVDLSTVDYGETLGIARRLGEAGIGFLDAPISGMEKRAIDGTLTVMCGGDHAVFETVKPFLDRIGNNILHMGANGAGQLTKLINQLLFDINCAGIAEILPMAVKMGLDPAQIEAVVNSGTGRSYASEFFAPRILKGDFTEGYPMSLAYKDLVSAAKLCADAGVPIPVTAAATATYQIALRQGHGDKNKGAMALVFEDLLGVKFRSKG
jgi:3-hydroxyisobutyrate dehydrogenase-like beta-hydroxyacid dehydrogenase